MNPNMTSMSAEQSRSLSDMLDRKFGTWLGARYFEVKSQADASVLQLTITMRDAKGAFVYPIESRIAYQDQDLKINEARDLLLDYVGAYLEEFLTGGESILLTIDWSEYECDGIDLQMRGQILNMNLEQMADDLLAGKGIDLEKLLGKTLN